MTTYARSPRTRSPRLKQVSRGVLTGTGQSPAEAKTDLARQIDAALEGTYNPAVVSYGGWSALVTRTPHGWGYQLFGGPDGTRPIAPDGINDVWRSSMLGADTTRDQAIQCAAHHVIQLAPCDFHEDNEIPVFLTDKSKREAVLHDCRWQRAFRWARDNQPDGRADHNGWHEWACWNCRDERFA